MLRQDHLSTIPEHLVNLVQELLVIFLVVNREKL